MSILPEPEKLLPLKPLVFDVLLILNERERHGYGIAKALGASSSGAKRILPGNLYRSLSGMIDQGLIDRKESEGAVPDDDDRRRYFVITRFGRLVAQAEAERLADRVAAARAQKLLTGSGAR